MPAAVRVSDESVREARKFSKVDHRWLTGRTEHWARIGKCAEENPDLTCGLIEEILIGTEESDRGAGLSDGAGIHFSWRLPYRVRIRSPFREK